MQYSYQELHVLPKAGIYAVKIYDSAIVRKYIHHGVAYLGSRPTFKGKEIFLEINIFGIEKNLYRKRLRSIFFKIYKKMIKRFSKFSGN